jgi:hypothetical protein
MLCILDEGLMPAARGGKNISQLSQLTEKERAVRWNGAHIDSSDNLSV